MLPAHCYIFTIQPNSFGRWREKSCQQYSNVLDVLQGIISGFAGTDLYNIFYIINEDLAVADLAGVQNLLDCIDDLLRRDALPQPPRP